MRWTGLVVTLLLAACSSQPGAGPPAVETPDVADSGAVDTAPAPVDCAKSRDGTTCRVTDAGGRWVCYEGRCVDPEAEPDTGPADTGEGGADADARDVDAGAGADADACECSGVNNCCLGCRKRPDSDGRRCRIGAIRGQYKCRDGQCESQFTCSPGEECCDGCFPEPKSEACGQEEVRTCEGGGPKGCGADAIIRIHRMHCDGREAECVRGDPIEKYTHEAETCLASGDESATHPYK